MRTMLLTAITLIALPARAEVLSDSEPREASQEPQEQQPAPVEAIRPNSARLAVLLMPSESLERETADNLSEVLIARLGEVSSFETVGTAEFRATLDRQDEGARDCLESPTCLGRVGVELRVTQIIAGTVGARPGGYLFDVVRMVVASGSVRSRVFRDVDGDLAVLVGAVSDAALPLLEEPEEPGSLRVESPIDRAAVYLDDEHIGTTPVNRGGIMAGSHRVRVEAEGFEVWQEEIVVSSGTRASLFVQLQALPRAAERSLGVALTAWSLVALGGAGLIAAGVFGGMSQLDLPPGEMTRIDATQFYDEREDFALTANVLFGVGGAVLLAGALLVILDWPQVFGSPVHRGEEARGRLGGSAAWVF